ncbi:hypothetical protein DAEQUDRAFT_815601 [Daedalea quercina L-15889]|uniref:Uncharacterized protein n=1 Tax=Daedalea quercina L-15889 TaxID=1314783 RepID=A0A165KSD0_9APHY|nr:hypothetical protein DAEQUDRAFT_815601 [Daedalea quercina L-15889]
MPARSRTSSASPTKAGANRAKNGTPGRRAAPPRGEVSPARALATRKGGARAAGGRRKRAEETEQASDLDREEGDHGGPAADVGAGDEDDGGEEEEVEAVLDSDALDDSPGEHQANGAKRKRESRGGAKAKANNTRKKRRCVQDKAYKYDRDEDDDEPSLDSDALDEDDDVGAKRKRGRPSVTKKATPKKGSPKKKRKQDEGSEDEDGELDLKDGQEVVGVVVQAPKTGRVPPGQISKNTLNFLSELRKPECNDREWFKLHEPVYRLAEKEWKDFIDAFTPLLVEVDPQIPHLPPKDVIHRIYRDIRFSNDKTPYKTGFSASFSRSGRKGIFAHYHILVKPGGESLIAAGAWQPGKNELATIRSNILRSPRRLREIISAPDFVRYFGEPTPDAKGERSSIFGREDELKNAPKGVAKDHPDIDLLKCRSFAVIHHFLDSEVLAPDFKQSLCKVVKIVKPFVHCLNDMMTIQDRDSSDEDEDGEEGGDDGDEDD